jgi:ABC-type multidrug transport system fused ATPase/permease subunit
MRFRELLSTYLKPQWRRVALLTALLLLGIGLALVNPQVVRFFIDSAMRQVSGWPLVFAALVYLLTAFLHQGINVAADYLTERIAWKSTNALRYDLTLHCLRLDLPFHKAHAPGELIERIDGDVSALGHILSAFISQIIGNGMLLAGVLIALWIEDWRIGIGMTVYVLVALVVLSRLQKLGVRQWAPSRQAEAAHYSFLEERLLGTEDIRSSGAEQSILTRLHDLMLTMLRTFRTASLVSHITRIVTSGLYAIGYAIGLGIGIGLFQAGQISIGTAYLIVAYITLIAGPLEGLRREMQSLQQAGAAAGRVAALLAEQPLVRDGHSDGSVRLPSGACSVDVDDLTFRYDETTLALDDVSLHLAPGEIVGVLGRTGSGKTSLTRVLFRLFDPQAGRIRLDGIDTRTIALSQLRARVALVTQEVQLFDASIRDNLALFNRSTTDDQIEQALRALGLWDWVQARAARELNGRNGKEPGQSALAHKLGGLSAGEGQLLAFARAFLKDPGLVVLDEASSRLDPGTEQLLDQAVSRLMAGRTGIIIAHRLRTVQRADSIVIFERGRVVEYGRRESLAQNPDSRFYKLLQTGLDDWLNDESPASETSNQHAEEVAALEVMP